MSPALGAAILVLLFAGPLLTAPLERNIELYFLAIGVLASVLAGRLNAALLLGAARAPIMITAAVVVAGALFAGLRNRFDSVLERLRSRLALRTLVAAAVFLIALVSGFVTAIVGALILAETVNLLRLEEDALVRVTVVGCFAIGLGAALTPIGYPLGAIAAHELGLEPLGLFRLLGLYVLPGTVACAVLAGLLARPSAISGALGPPRHVQENLTDVLLQAGKIYGFVAGLVLISEAFAPLAPRYVSQISSNVLFWVNTASAALDNATLVALEIHGMDPTRARMALIALLISGGMLIPGNIPNIICAGTLKIGSAAWARAGVPLGLAIMALYFLALNCGAAG